MQKAEILQVKGSKCPVFLFKGELEARLAKWFFKRVDSTIGCLVEKVYLHFKQEGLCIYAIDSSHVAIALFKLAREDFPEYDLHEEFKIGVNVSDLGKVFNQLIKLGDKNVKIQVESTDKIKFNYASLKAKKIEEYSEKEDNIMEKLEEILKDKWVSLFTISEGDLRSVLTSCEIISDLVKISTDSGTITFHSYDEGGEFERPFDKHDNEITEFELKEAEGLYSLNFLTAFVQSNSFSPKRRLKSEGYEDTNEYITVKLGYNIPACFKLEFENSSFVYLLSPRVEDNDDDDFDDTFDDDDFEENLLDTDLPTQETIPRNYISEDKIDNEYHEIGYNPRTVPNPIDNTLITSDNVVIAMDDYLPEIELPVVEFVKSSDLLEDPMKAEINRVVQEYENRGELSSSSRIREKQIHQIKGQINKRGN